MCVFVSLCLCLSVCHAHYSAVSSPFGKPEVLLEPYRQGHAIFQVSKNFTHVFMQFHAIFTQFRLFQPFLGQFQHVGYQNACSPAEKFIGNTFEKFQVHIHAISRNFHAIWAISAIFGPISTSWVSKCIYSS